MHFAERESRNRFSSITLFSIFFLLFGTGLVHASLTLTSWTASNQSIDIGQTQTLTVSIAGSNKPFTYNFLVYNTIGLVDNSLFSSNGKTQTFSFAQSSAWGTGTFTANITVTDAAAAQVSGSLTYSVSLQLSTPTITTTNSVLDTGQTQKLTVSWSGGTSPFTVNFFNVTGGTKFNTLVGIATSPSTNTFIVNSPTTGNVFTWNGVVIDSATSQVTKNSISTTFTVNPALGVPTQAQYANSVSVGQAIWVTATLPSDRAGTGGSYTYNWLVFNSASAIVANALYTGKTATSSTYLFNGNGSVTGQLFYVNVLITDAATSPATANSANGHSIVVVPCGGCSGGGGGGGGGGVPAPAPPPTIAPAPPPTVTPAPTATITPTATIPPTTVPTATVATTVPATTVPATTVPATTVPTTAHVIAVAPVSPPPPVGGAAIVGAIVVAGTGASELRKRLMRGGYYEKVENRRPAGFEQIGAIYLAVLIGTLLLFFAYGYFLESAIVAFGSGVAIVYLLDAAFSKRTNKKIGYERSGGAFRFVEELAVIEAVILAAAIYSYFYGFILQSILLAFLFGVTFTTMLDKVKIRRERYILGITRA